MKSRLTHGLPLAAALLAGGLLSAPAQAASVDAAVGQVVAASQIAADCPKIKKIGNGDTQSFVLAATDLIAQQEGFGSQKTRGLLFYGKTKALNAAGAAELAARGVDLADKAELCGFGKSVAGKNDQIGRFLKVAG